MFDFLLDALIVLSMTAGYWGTAAALASMVAAIFMLAGMLLPGFRSRMQQAEKSMELSILLWKPPILLSLSLCIALYFPYSLWREPAVLLWKNPLLLGCLALYAAYGSRGAGSYNPQVREAASGVWLSVVPALWAAALGWLFPNVVSDSLVKWGIFAGLLIALVDQLTALVYIRPRAKQYEIVDKRHDRLGEELSRLKHLQAALGESVFGPQLSETLRRATDRYTNAFGALRAGNLRMATDQIVLGEFDVATINEHLSAREKYGVAPEIEKRAIQLRQDLSELRSELGEAEIPTGRIDELDMQLAGVLGRVTDRPLAESAQILEPIFQEIVDIRTATQFRANIDQEIEALDSEFLHETSSYALGNLLGLDTSALATLVSEYRDSARELRKFRIGSSQELLALYNTLQGKAAGMRTEGSKLARAIEQGWACRKSGDTALTVYVPKRCPTTEAVGVGILVDWSRVTPATTAAFNLDGALVKLSRSELELVRRESTHSGGGLQIAGEKAGRGTLSIRSSKDAAFEPVEWRFPVRVTPTVSELVRDASLWAAPIAGLALLVGWQQGLPPQQYGSASVALGSVAALLIFFVRYYQMTRVQD